VPNINLNIFAGLQHIVFNRPAVMFIAAMYILADY